MAPAKRPPLIDDDRLATWRALLNAHSAATRAIEADLKDAGLPPLGWYDVLWPLHGAPERRLRMSELAREAVLSRTGLVRREPVPEDGRGAYVAITDAGVETLRRIWPVYAAGIERHFLEPVGSEA